MYHTTITYWYQQKRYQNSFFFKPLIHKAGTPKTVRRYDFVQSNVETVFLKVNTNRKMAETSSL